MTRMRLCFAPLLGLLVGCGDDGPSIPASGTFDVERIVPTDTRPAVIRESPPPPISGGTLHFLPDGVRVVASDPDRDLVFVADVERGVLLHRIELEPGDEPGRVVSDGSDRAHVALRGSGGVATLDVASGRVVLRRAVCGAPRGLAYDPSADQLHVACSTGELVTYPSSGEAAVRTLNLGPDLRDVVVHQGRVTVSRFKRASTIVVEADGSVRSESTPRGIEGSPEFFDPFGATRPLAPAGAWRMVGAPDGTVAMLHQYAFLGSVPIEAPDPADGFEGGSSGGSAYGGGGGDPRDQCNGVVAPGVSRIASSGEVRMGRPLPGGVLTVDVALSPDARWAAVAHAGNLDPDTPRPFFQFRDELDSPIQMGGAEFVSASGSLTFLELGDPSLVPEDGPDGFGVPCAGIVGRVDVPAQTTAVAINPRLDAEARNRGLPWVVAQSREPARLMVFPHLGNLEPRIIELDAESVYDTGHELFHRDTGAGIACASCHLEGAEDGRAWRFERLGLRRTQSLNVGLEGTGPFHWDGDMRDFHQLVEEVFVGRMGAARPSGDRRLAFENWLYTLEPSPPLVAADDIAALRGRKLFHSAEVGCGSCHVGPSLTNGQSYNVGTTEPGHAVQVPSLVGVGMRAPFLHDGCAPNLEDRFDPSCGGGDRHGRTSQLSEAQLGDLVAYLKSL